MRKYNLTITDDSGKTWLNALLDKHNPMGPEIQFNIQQYFSGLTVNNTITGFNDHPFWFSENQNLYGKRISLSAGMDDTPMIRALGYSGSPGLICGGWITAAIPEWNGKDTQLAMVVQAYDPNQSNKNLFNFSVEINDPLIPKINEAFKNITGGTCTLDTSLFTSDKFAAASKCGAKLNLISELDSTLRQSYFVGIVSIGSGYKLVPIIAGSKAAMTLPQGTVIKPIMLQPGDFLNQPSLVEQTLSQVAMTLIMRSDIQVGSVVNIPQGIYVGISNLDVVRDATALIDMFKGKTVFSMYSGNYLVVKVWQSGDSRNPDAQAWATNIVGQKL